MHGGEEHGAASPLRQSVLGAVDDVVPDVVAEAFERGDEVVEDRVRRDRRNVFHCDDIWLSLFHETSEVVEKTPARGPDGLVAVRVAGEGLARSATGEDANRG